VSNYYAQVMKEKMALPAEKLKTVHLGVEPEDYTFTPVSRKKRAIGFVSRMSHANGLDILVDAFILLRQWSDFKDVKLILTGGYTGDDRKFLSEIRSKLRERELLDQVEFHRDFEEEGLRDFLGKVSVVSVPVRNGEAFGIYLLECMVSGVPVVQPALGAFPEIVETAGGGVTYQPNDPEHLAASLAGILGNPPGLDQLSREGAGGVKKHFNINQQAEQMIRIYREAIEACVPDNTEKEQN